MTQANMKFDVILADPPWEFERWVPGQGVGIRSADSHYPTMKTSELCRLSIPEVLAKNAVLFLWGVWPRLKDTFELIDAWGFEYKTIAWIWIKAKRSGFGFFTGMGYYTRSNTEPCLLAVKGSMPVQAHDIQALIYAPVHDHSQKPDDQYRKIETLYPNMNYLELFARKQQPGWHVWGNEVPSTISMTAHDPS